MIRSELIQKVYDDFDSLIATEPGDGRPTQAHAERVVNTIFSEITEALASGNRVELRGFGAFSVKHRDSRTGRNQRTGESVPVSEKSVPFFKTGKLLRDRLNDK